MARAGLPRRHGEGILDYARRIAAERPELEADALAVARTYVRLRYAEEAPHRVDDLQRRVRRLRPSAPASR